MLMRKAEAQKFTCFNKLEEDSLFLKLPILVVCQRLFIGGKSGEHC